MANADLSPTKTRLLGDRVPPRGHADFSTTLFTGLTAGVFLILIACVVASAILFSQGL